MKKSNLHIAIEALEAEKRVLEMAIAKLQQQIPTYVPPRKKRGGPKAVMAAEKQTA